MISRNYETTYSGHTFKVEAVSGVDTNDTCTLTIDGKVVECRECDPDDDSALYAFNDIRDTLIQVFKCLKASEK